MKHFPNFKNFCQLAQEETLVPVCRRIFADALTPLSAFARIDTGTDGCLFESVIGGEKVGRYSFLGSEPFLQFEAHGPNVTIRRQGQPAENIHVEDPLAELEKRMAEFKPARLNELPPFTSGAIGYAAYDAIRYAEHLPNIPVDDLGLPDIYFALYDRLVVFDHVSKSIDIVALAKITTKSAESIRTAYESAKQRVDETIDKLNQHCNWPPINDIGSLKPQTQTHVTANRSRQDFLEAAEKAIDYIHAGDIFQVVLSRRISVPFEASPLELYRTLRVVNPSPFMFCLRTPNATLVGSSPEIMVRVMDQTVTVRPLAGTRPRGNTPEEDAELAAGLLADPKERAEHVMLIDLGRNDVGRVSEIGSVELSDVMAIERYSHVMHITSNVCGKLKPQTTAFDSLRACLPAGTVSGAPKIRAMEIIDELEPNKRGPYAGAVGYIDFTGTMDTCIALRTIVLAHGKAYVQSGAGIVADSLPEKEFEETLNKAKGLLVAIDMTTDRLKDHGSKIAGTQ
ncbi:MAG: anthranilate synthase component I [Planctomycetaceae bacterium]|nr:anthranilate synthase component I [Planctomycetaceae bacterium]MBT7727790.1 anthranilate synthase component I [Planctomycetaceae bacterium]